MTLPRKWATTENYPTGVDVGTPSRVDPGAGIAASGFIPHTGIPAQHLNDIVAGIIDAMYAYQETPEEYAEIREDFIGAVFDSTTDILHANHHWQVTSTENAVVATDAPVHPGTVQASLLTTEEFEMELAGQQNNIRWGEVQDVTIIARVTTADLEDHQLFVGLAENFEVVGVGNNAVGLWFSDTTVAGTWLLRHKVGGVDDATTTGVAVVSGTWVKMKLHRISLTQVEVYFEDDLVATLTDGVDAPDDSTLLTVGMLAKAGTATMTPACDKIYVKWNTPAR